MNLRSLLTGRLTHLAAKRSSRRATGASSSRRAAAVALLAGAGAYALLHFGLALAAARSPLISDPFYADKEVRLAALERSAPGAPVVVALGSSQTLNGFVAGRVGPVATAAGFPAVVYNFGAPGAGPITQALYVRRLLADGHAPHVLLFEVMPALFADTPNGPPDAARLLGDRLTWAEIDLVTNRYGFPAEFVRARRSAADRRPWDVHRFKLISRLEPEALPCQSRIHVGRASDAHGWFGLMPDLVYDPAGFAHAVDNYALALRDWKPGPKPALALRDTLALCREREITVALLLMPESRAFRALCPAPARDRLNAFLAGVSAEFGCPLIDTREWMPDDGFVDGHHLLRHAAVTFTDRLTAESILPLLHQRGKP